MQMDHNIACGMWMLEQAFTTLKKTRVYTTVRKFGERKKKIFKFKMLKYSNTCEVTYMRKAKKLTDTV